MPALCHDGYPGSTGAPSARDSKAMAYRTTPKMAERKAARRQKFLDTAVALFARHGYHGTTVPMITTKARSSTGSFYFYFKDKEDLLAAVWEDFATRLSAALNEAIGRAKTTLGQMRAAVEALVIFLAENPAEARILVVETSGLGGRVERIRRDTISSHARSVEAALLSLGLPGLNPHVHAQCWLGSVYQSIYNWLETPADQRIPPHLLAEAVAEFNLRGIGAPQKNIRRSS